MGKRTIPRKIQRNIEASVCKRLMKWRQNHVLRVSKLTKSNIYLPKSKVTMHYLERQGIVDGSNSGDDGARTAINNNEQQQQRSLLLIHGMSDSADAMVEMLLLLDIPKDVRVVLIDIIGHGEDLQRAREYYERNEPFPYPNASQLTDIVLEFVQTMKLGVVSSNSNNYGPPPPSSLASSSCCDVIGYSLGGALTYWLRQRDDKGIIGKTVLISPAIQTCIGDKFMNEIESGIPVSHFDWKRRKELKDTFDKLKPIYDSDNDGDETTGGDDTTRTSDDNDNNCGVAIEPIVVDNKKQKKKKSRKSKTKNFIKKKNNETAKGGVPDFFLESILRYHMSRVPPNGHYKQLIENLRTDNPPEYYSSIDVDVDSPRLVLWPENDYICDYKKGKTFFEEATTKVGGNTTFITLPDCGHVFYNDGKFLLERNKKVITDYLYKD